jgi:hypothetical protein
MGCLIEPQTITGVNSFFWATLCDMFVDNGAAINISIEKLILDSFVPRASQRMSQHPESICKDHYFRNVPVDFVKLVIALDPHCELLRLIWALVNHEHQAKKR